MVHYTDMYKVIIFDFYGVFTGDTFNEWALKNLTTETQKQIRTKLMPDVDRGNVSAETFFQ